jgi:hypothetical protein
MFNRSWLVNAARRGTAFPKPAKWLANFRVVLFYQVRGGGFHPGGGLVGIVHAVQKMTG